MKLLNTLNTRVQACLIDVAERVNSPQVLVGVGLVLGAAAIVTAALRTPKAITANEEFVRDIDLADDIEDAREHATAIGGAYGTYARKLIIAYGPVAILWGGSVWLIRNGVFKLVVTQANLASALNVVSQSFATYRKNVRDELGAEADNRYMYGGTIVPNPDGDGYTTHYDTPMNPDSTLSRLYDSTNITWVGAVDEVGANKFILRSQQDYFTMMLHANGTVLLNDVYERLGFPRTQAGCVLGWSIRNGDSHVDFGLDNQINIQANDVIGYYLEFNPSGRVDRFYSRTTCRM